MTAENRIQGFANNFWKYASNTKGVLAIEDAFINWANNSDMTIKEFGHVWSKIHDDIYTKFGLKKADISFSRTEDLLEIADMLKNMNVEDIDDVNDLELPNTEEPATFEPSLAEPPNTENEIPSSTPPETETPPIEEGGEKPELKLTESLLL
jgi:hypothetical protein